VSASRDALLDIFERIQNAFRRLEIYIAVPSTAGMTNAIVDVMVEVLHILATVTKEVKQGRASESILGYRSTPSTYRLPEMFVKKLVGRKDVEDALQRLENVTVEEARMAAAEALKAIHDVSDKVGDGVQGIHDAVKAVEDRMRDVEGIIRGVDDRVKGIGDMVTIGAQKVFGLSSLFSLFTLLSVTKLGRQVTNDPDKMRAESLKTMSNADNKTRAIRDTLGGVSDRAGNINNIQVPENEIEASGVDGTQLIPNLRC